MTDLYKVLGVPKGASDAELKKAYRKLAKELHPDKNPDDKKISDRFKKVSAAYGILGDTKKRARYDRGEIDADGDETAHGRGFRGFHPGARGGPQGGFESAGFDFGGINAEDIFSDLFAATGQRGRSQRRQFRAKGVDRTYKLAVSFEEAATGSTKRVSLMNGKTLDVKIPAGVEDGKQIRLKGQGETGEGGAPAGDALVEIKIKRHKFFTRDGDNVYVDLPVTLEEAVLGGKVVVPTIHGQVTVTIPKDSNTGKRLRLKGKGIKPAGAKKAGDQYVMLSVMLPEGDKSFEELVRDWASQHSYEVREDMAD